MCRSAVLSNQINQIAKTMKGSQKIQCPCCKQIIDKSGIQHTIQLFPFNGAFKAIEQSWADSFLQVTNAYKDFYQWACDTCLKKGMAILGKPAKQNYTFKNPADTAAPFLAYFDKRYTCQQCKNKFVFTKSEQQYWFEELKFVVYSKPIHCPTCRKEVRGMKQLNTQLSNLLKDGPPQTVAGLEQVAEIYKKMGASEKEKMYLTLAKKVKKKG